MMVWSCFSGAGLGPLVPVKGTLNASAYQEMLDNSMLPTSNKDMMREFGVGELDWPDLNPIEHLWDELEQRLRARSSCPASVCDLTNALLEEWSKIHINTLLNLVESLPRRAEAVIAVT